MSLNVRRFTTGIQLVPVSSVTIDKAGELSFSTSTNQFYGHNGTSPLALSTVTGTETLTNKTLTSPIINTATADTITGITGGALTLTAASGQNLVLNAVGNAVVVQENLNVGGNGGANSITGAAVNVLVSGRGNSVSTNQGVALGLNNTLTGHNSIVLGSGNTVSANFALAGGNTSQANGNDGLAWGLGVRSDAVGQIAFGVYNVPQTPGVNTSTDRIFSIGSGSGVGTESDSFYILRNGITFIQNELRLNGSTSGYVGFKSAASPTSYSLVMPSAQGGASTFLQNDGAGNLSWVVGATGANTALSNLASVAINTDLLPSGVNNRDLGSASLPFRNSFTQRMFLTNGTGNIGVFDGTSQTLPDGSTAAISISNAISSDTLGIMTGLNIAADGTPSGDIKIETGNKTAGTGNSGTIVLQSGTSSGGTRGSIKVNGNGINVKGAAFIGASNEIQSTALTNGQILVGSTGNTPVAATITAGSGISVTNAAGSITIANTGSPSPNSEVFVTGGNGYGSTNTKIRRLVTTQINTGSDISYSDSATNGGAFTINTTGIYSVTMNDGGTNNGAIGMSINSNQLTTTIENITAINRLGWALSDSFGGKSCSATIHCTAGDVIRLHADGINSATADSAVSMRVTRIG